MSTLVDKTMDDAGNITINMTSNPEDSITLTTANTYVDKNIVFNFDLDMTPVTEDEINNLFAVVIT